jgi:hypothetical protein
MSSLERIIIIDQSIAAILKIEQNQDFILHYVNVILHPKYCIQAIFLLPGGHALKSN